METILTSETFVVFAAGERRLAINAMHVRSTAIGSSWTGEAPLLLGTFSHTAPTAPMRVLEVETSDEQSIPVLAVGGMRLRTVDASDVTDASGDDVTRSPEELREFVSGWMRDEFGLVFVLEPDALLRGRDRLPKFAAPRPG